MRLLPCTERCSLPPWQMGPRPTPQSVQSLVTPVAYWHPAFPPSLSPLPQQTQTQSHREEQHSTAQRRGHPVSNPRGMSWHCSCLPGARLPDARGAGPGRPSRAHSCLVAAGQPVCARSAAMIGECIHGGLYFCAERQADSLPEQESSRQQGRATSSALPLTSAGSEV